jgi:copper chaperone NosL
MSITSRLLVALAAVLLLGTLVTPIWRVNLVAPQYPEGLGMEIRAHTVRGMKEHDLRNINSLNHYIGMKPITPESIPELRIIPWVIGGLAATGLLVAAIGRRRLLWAWLTALVVCGIVGMVDFWRWEYSYGHDLDLENAIISVPGMTYQPPLIGSKQLLNFTAESWPATGAILAGLAFSLGTAALVLSRRQQKLAENA